VVGLTHFYPKELMALITAKTNGPKKMTVFVSWENCQTRIGVFAEDTLPLNIRTYELPDTTIYTVDTLID